MAEVNFLAIVFGSDLGVITVRPALECRWVSLATALTQVRRNQGDIKAAGNAFLHGGRCRKALSWQFCGDVLNAEPAEKMYGVHRRGVGNFHKNLASGF